jgi:uncharacterized protein YdhG (YjbR/CyaY superfamily)
MKTSPPGTVDEYLATMPAPTRAKLEGIRQTIHEVAPETTEKIAYGIPTFVLHGNLVHSPATRTTSASIPERPVSGISRMSWRRTRRARARSASR